MNILLVSQCKKRALTETRRIIDQFAERCGERTWQTPITSAGLQTLYKLLRKTARKNTAVACYWTHGKNQTDLLWIVGDKSQFNQQGRVPTNRTKRDILRSDNENSWQHAISIQLIATIAALLHDLGKATVGFQDKLRKASITGDPYRHEWISLQLFLLMIHDCTTNQEVLTRLANFADYQQQKPDWYLKLSKIEKCDLSQLPLFAQWIGWLIVSHHRMPFLMPIKYKDCQEKQKDDFDISQLTTKSFFKTFKAVEKWVKNSDSQHPFPEHFWQLKSDITLSQTWLKKLSRYASKAFNHAPLMQLTEVDTLLLHLSRLSLMVADHNYSSLPCYDKEADEDTAILIANTNKGPKAKQRLDDHLIGVANLTARFARLLPKLSEELPAINQHKPFTKRTTNKRFQWQNHAFDLSRSYQQLSDNNGFFGVNMASTGCGKTLANGRIMYALSSPQRGVRFTIALGLRVLTLQTGNALRERLHLTDEHLAILVGGKAIQTLFDLENQNKTSDNKPKANLDSLGCESIESLVDEFIDVAESGIADNELGTIIENSKARKLIYTPIVTCTVDHLMQASECVRGGKYIAPTLRLLTSDLILDEPDDFDQQDLPALARLVHLAGLYGSKVLLSSATLTPDLIVGLFDAYQAGRKIFNQNNGKHDSSIVCGWFDEYQQSIEQILDTNNFRDHHNQFVEQRVKKLEKGVCRRQGQILELLNYSLDKKENLDQGYALLAKQLLEQAYHFHLDHHQQDEKSSKKISIGLMRFAHIDDVMLLTKQFYNQTELPADVKFHLVVYHARQLLLLRSQLEEKLDRILNRSDPNQLFEQLEIHTAIANSDKKNQIFIVIGTPVTEVGRDHDYDWAIIEPSSMRSIIQLVGRVWRHRPEKIAQKANVAILGSNLKSIKYGNNLGIHNPCFTKPGFEQKSLFLLKTHKTDQLITSDQLMNINAAPRIISDNQNELTLAGLEHYVMANLFPVNAQKCNYVTSYWQPNLAHHHCVHLQLISPFRMPEQSQDEYICQLDEEGEHQFSYAEIAWQTPNELSCDLQNSNFIYQNWQFDNPLIQPWLTNTVKQALAQIAEYIPYKNYYRLANEFCTVNLNSETRWRFHPYFGFYKDSY
ncbi:type I-F CRISPR-associated helicase Cas3 [Gilliamella sp. B2923]|uniref:type I-F CRISPR-associated helicase Cas3f n=1 Tax=Gilliamella sp. B2923 TaxID=2818005 RepID=UPI002269A510|nr:type I-F CRISPR-associated helicase Cas3f [Gilliamella sp. B2923]MCX8617086.1 type I-F CRISPR-associated helicase Cas3 [Gilliamella sp. B2923]